jgi:hypothetical protein
MNGFRLKLTAKNKNKLSLVITYYLNYTNLTGLLKD